MRVVCNCHYVIHTYTHRLKLSRMSPLSPNAYSLVFSAASSPLSRLQRAAPPDLSPPARVPLIDSLSAARHTAQSLTWKNSAGCFGSITVYSSLSRRKRGRFAVHLCLYVLHLNNRCPFGVLVGTYWHSLRLSFSLSVISGDNIGCFMSTTGVKGR